MENVRNLYTDAEWKQRQQFLEHDLEPEFERQRLFDKTADLDDAERIQAQLDELQRLADRPQLRHRLGLGRVSAAMPFADSRQPTDPADGTRLWVMDYSFSAHDAEKNYAAGLL
jgi:hypothetical protein